MRYEGRRKSDNVLDIRRLTEPKDQAKAMFIERSGRPDVMDQQGEDQDRLVDYIQDVFGRRDAEGMEMLLGPRWKD